MIQRFMVPQPEVTMFNALFIGSKHEEFLESSKQPGIDLCAVIPQIRGWTMSMSRLS